MIFNNHYTHLEKANDAISKHVINFEFIICTLAVPFPSEMDTCFSPAEEAFLILTREEHSIKLTL